MIILNHFEIKESLLCSNPPRVLPISKIHNDTSFHVNEGNFFLNPSVFIIMLATST